MKATVTLSLPADTGRDLFALLRDIEAETGAAPEATTHGAADVFRFTGETLAEAAALADGICRVLTDSGEARPACVVLTAPDGGRTHFHPEAAQ